jgi:pilus assembly protein CpaE
VNDRPAVPARVVVATPPERLIEIATWVGGLPAQEVVDRATDVSSAMTALTTRRADIVVATTDLAGGWRELVDRLAAQDSGAGAVVILTEPAAGIERDALRAGALAAVAMPLDGEADREFAEALREQERRRRRRTTADARPGPATAGGPLICIVSAKGGVGRSFVAVNLASLLAQRQRVALCDLDLQFSDISYWGSAEPPDRTIDQLAAVVSAGEVQLADVQTIAQTRFGSVALLPGVRTPVEGVAWASEHGARAVRLVGALRAWYDTVVVDNLPGLLEPVITLGRSASLLIVVTTCEVGSLRATKRYLGFLDRYAPVPRLIVANRANRGERAKLVRAALGPGERSFFVNEDRTMARRLTVEGLAASQQRGRGVSRAFGRLAKMTTPVVAQ